MKIRANLGRVSNAEGLSKVDIQNLVKLSVQNLSKPIIQNLTKPDIQTMPKTENLIKPGADGELLESIKKEFSEQYAHVREDGKKTNAKVSRLVYNITTAKTDAVRFDSLNSKADEPLILSADFFRLSQRASSMDGLCGASKGAPVSFATGLSTRTVPSTPVSVGVWAFKPNLGVHHV
jgi:hypothetical protein